MDKVVFSGIQPSGDFHIGNYIGAIQRWVKGQEDGLNIFCIVDLHAITVEQDPKELHKKTLELAGLLVACGINPEKSILFVQSHNPDHANLAWVLNCFTGMGHLSRMTQYKDKSEGKDFISVGLFDYPVLMAADILLYDTTEVPVGIDQKQHVELTRDIAERFNAKYGDTFVLPEPKVAEQGAKIMSLSDPAKKMSKSDPQSFSRIELLDSEDLIKQKLQKAVTRTSESFDPSSPGVANLVEIYSSLTGKKPDEVNKEFSDKKYKEIKEILAVSTISKLKPIQERFKKLQETDELDEILAKGANKVRQISSKKLKEVYEKVGFVN